MSLPSTLLTIRPKCLVKLAGAALLLAAAAPVSAQTPVVFGDTISDPGVYFLHGNQSGSGIGISIESNDVLLLLGRFTLRGDDSSLGIAAYGRENVTIHGGRVTHFSVGIDILDGRNCTVKDTRINYCGGDGLRIRNTDQSNIVRVRCDHNDGNGVAAQGVDDSRFLSILAHDNGENGILLGPQAGAVVAELGNTPISERNRVKLCWAAYNDYDGIRLDDADDNEVERNQCVENDAAGIRLASVSGDTGVVNAIGSQRNNLRSNWCVFNDEGIRVEWSSADNTLTNNTALANLGHDMVDRNFEVPCVNTWYLNFFLTKDGDGEDCIF